MATPAGLKAVAAYAWGIGPEQGDDPEGRCRADRLVARRPCRRAAGPSLDLPRGELFPARRASPRHQSARAWPSSDEITPVSRAGHRWLLHRFSAIGVEARDRAARKERSRCASSCSRPAAPAAADRRLPRQDGRRSSRRCRSRRRARRSTGRRPARRRRIATPAARCASRKPGRRKRRKDSPSAAGKIPGARNAPNMTAIAPGSSRRRRGDAGDRQFFSFHPRLSSWG